MQNMNRSNSYDRIDIGLFKELWPFQPVKMTISPQSVATLAEGVIFLLEQGFAVDPGLAYGVEWREEHYEILARELEKLADFYAANPETEPCRLVDMRLELDLRRPERNIKWCGTGTNMISIGINGEKYPCHMFAPSTELSGDNIKIYSRDIFSMLTNPQSDLVDELCTSCMLLHVCPTCYGMNFRESGSILSRSKSMCRFTKIRAKANAYLLAKTLENREKYKFLRDREDFEIYRMIENTELIDEGVRL